MGREALILQDRGQKVGTTEIFQFASLNHRKIVVVDAGELERIGRGLYTFQGAEQSEHHSLVQVTRLVFHAAICLLSALRFHDLTSQNPHEVWIAIDPKDRKPSLDYPSVKVVRYGAERFGIGLEEHEVERAMLRVYSVARTVVDLFR